jgi:hypothetical protein
MGVMASGGKDMATIKADLQSLVEQVVRHKGGFTVTDAVAAAGGGRQVPALQLDLLDTPDAVNVLAAVSEPLHGGGRTFEGVPLLFKANSNVFSGEDPWRGASYLRHVDGVRDLGIVGGGGRGDLIGSAGNATTVYVLVDPPVAEKLGSQLPSHIGPVNFSYVTQAAPGIGTIADELPKV